MVSFEPLDWASVTPSVRRSLLSRWISTRSKGSSRIGEIWAVRCGSGKHRLACLIRMRCRLQWGAWQSLEKPSHFLCRFCCSDLTFTVTSWSCVWLKFWTLQHRRRSADSSLTDWKTPSSQNYPRLMNHSVTAGAWISCDWRRGGRSNWSLKHIIKLVCPYMYR